MRGIILQFSIQENKGYISGDDGKRYVFIGKDWKEAFAPEKGKKVDFEVSKSDEAINIYSIGSQENDSGSVNYNEQSSEILEAHKIKLEAEKTCGTMFWFKNVCGIM
ncbi:hypothetical protein [Commensalibacter nepenthis]|uniref:CSD domain-containing protein n=1 Tax=Commensalibacter nepenthis TaxID=3043872 RepID=A0ABT6Q9E6_9PROT|nr:hypothetical protein [Commensalibacter sp. TBRC 10068]MDI2113532.1 hypothetical protein [Commensalibacter sp. TBRC 10068]